MVSGAWRMVGAAGCILAGSLLSCTSGTHPEPEIGQVPVVQDAGELVLPLDAFDYTTGSYEAFVEAKGMLTRDCLGRFGVEIPASAWDSGVLPSFDRRNARRYGLLDLAAAASRGYEPPPELIDNEQQFTSAAEIEEHRRSQGIWTPTEVEHFLLEGQTEDKFANRTLPLDRNGNPLPEDGCSGEAQRALADGLSDPLWPNDAGIDSFHRAETDSRVQAAMAAWSDCMKARGYQYSSVWEPNDRDWPDPVTDEEILTAVADVECKLETNLVGVWYAVESAYQREFIEDNAERLADLQTWLDTVAENSARVLREG